METNKALEVLPHGLPVGGGTPPDGQQKLQAILAEYAALRAEIQYRSDFQNRLIQLHATALTAIVAAILLRQTGPELALAVPIEASIIGLWFMDHAISINELGAYLRGIESRVNEMLGEDNLIGWESGYREGIVFPAKIQVWIFRSIIGLTFALPSLVSIVIMSALLLGSFPAAPGSAFINGLFGAPIVPQPQTVRIVLPLLVIDLALFLSYLLASGLRYRQVKEITRKVRDGWRGGRVSVS